MIIGPEVHTTKVFVADCRKLWLGGRRIKVEYLADDNKLICISPLSENHSLSRHLYKHVERWN